MASAVSGTHGKLFERVHLIPNRPNLEPIKNIFADMACPSRKLEQAQSLKVIEGAIRELQSKPLPGGLSAVVEKANQKTGKMYQGKIVALTEHHAVEQIGANKFVVHRRDQSATQALQLGKQATIDYGQQKNRTTPTKDKFKGPQR